jgi:hypothetical protein
MRLLSEAAHKTPRRAFLGSDHHTPISSPTVHA